MATRTIDLLLNLGAEKSPSVDSLKKQFVELEKKAAHAKEVVKGLLLIDGEGSASVKKARQNLNAIEQELKDINAQAQKMTLANKLQQIEAQANKTREKMEKLAQVGNKMALVGGAILTPFALAMKKYIEATKETEPNAQRIVELGQRWEQSQVRIGRVTAEILLPAMEKALNIIDQITAFAEKNPGAIKAALGIGGTLVVLGGMLSTAASIVSTIATVQGLLAGVGIGGGAAAGGTAITSAITAALPAVGTMLLGILTSPLTWAIAALFLVKPIMNWLLGTNQTWADIGETGRKALILIGYGIDKILKGVGAYFANLGNGIKSWFAGMAQKIYDGMYKLGEWIVRGIEKLLSFLPGRASGGYAGAGLYKLGENRQREFVMNGNTTKAAESIIGGGLTQERLLASLSGGRSITYRDNRRIDTALSKNQRAALVNDTMTALVGAL